jgi:YggT family protein
MASYRPALCRISGQLSFRIEERGAISAMPIIGYFLIALARVIEMVLTLYMWVVIASAVLSWVNPDPYNPIVRFIRNVTEPVLYRIRSSLPVSYSGIDFSPIVVIVAIVFLKMWIGPSIQWVGQIFL